MPEIRAPEDDDGADSGNNIDEGALLTMFNPGVESQLAAIRFVPIFIEVGDDGYLSCEAILMPVQVRLVES